MSDSPAPLQDTARPSAERWIYLAIIAIAFLLRVSIFPHSDAIRDVDEVGYLKGSLALLEGLPPGYKAAPAGPNFWVGWAYTGGVAAYDCLRPGPEEKRVPMQVRPFVALEHALFDQYRDLHNLHVLWVVTQLLLSLWATSAAWRIGRARGGLAGGIMLGGLMAMLPIFVEFTMMSRPYFTAWCFGVLALESAMLLTGRWRTGISGVFMGLAIASRVEMLLFVPVVLWEFWYRREPKAAVSDLQAPITDSQSDLIVPHAYRSLFGIWAAVVGVCIVTALLAAPWLLTHLIGNLRTIATVRLGPNPRGGTTLAGNLFELAWNDGFAGAMLALPIAFIAILAPGNFDGQTNRKPRRFDRLRVAVLGLYTSLLLASLGHGTVMLHQQGPVLLSLIVFGAFAAGFINRFSRATAKWCAVAVLVVPFIQTVVRIVQIHRDYSPDPSVAWVAAHIPAGTIVYTDATLQQLLPTPACARAAWAEVTDDAGWRRKFLAGLERFHVSAEELPPALSEENMVQERGNRRGFFILAGRADLPEARFDVRDYNGSPVFDVPEVFTAFSKTGGVMIWHGVSKPEMGRPLASWANASGVGVYIYCSPEIRPLVRSD